MDESGVVLGFAPGAALHPMGEDARSLATQIRMARQARLHRQTNADPSLSGRTAELEATPVYNARALLLQTTGRAPS
jgi:hypothetical protein